MQHDQVTTRIAVMLFRILQFFPEENRYSPWIHGLKYILKVFTILSVGFDRMYLKGFTYISSWNWKKVFQNTFFPR